MRVAGLQCDLTWEDAAANRARLGPRIDAAAHGGARLVVLPEMWPTGFSMDAERVAEDEGGASERFLVDAAVRTGAAVGGSIAQFRVGASGLRVAGVRPRNTFVLALPDGAVHRYAKIHPFTYGGEADHYDAGADAITVLFDGVRITPLVCYDLRFPEAFAALAGRTDLFVVVANWPAARILNWTVLLQARAIETQAFVLGVNRVGTGGGLEYPGGSRLVSPLGAVLDGADSAGGVERVVAGTVDPAEVAAVRTRFPFLADRRPGVYARLRGEGGTG
ncbi:MAG: carbon-nitrogen family hydrolase [Planctomycetes bacterium]|nr:carbon-nitrogen family hydrolase [Planctomycetota bacterium]